VSALIGSRLELSMQVAAAENPADHKEAAVMEAAQRRQIQVLRTTALQILVAAAALVVVLTAAQVDRASSSSVTLALSAALAVQLLLRVVIRTTHSQLLALTRH